MAKAHWIAIDADGEIMTDDNCDIRKFKTEKEAVSFVESRLADQGSTGMEIYKLTHVGELTEYEPDITVTKVKP